MTKSLKWLYVFLFISSLFSILYGLYYMSINNEISVINKGVIALSNGIILVILILIPTLFEKITQIKLPHLLKQVYLIFIWISIFLGEAIGLYRYFFYYDYLVHTLGGMVIALFALSMILSIKKDSPIYNFIAIICLVSFIGTIWEIFEYTLDSLIHSNMQSYADDLTHQLFIGHKVLDDTMWDLILNTVGSIIFGLIYLIYPEYFLKLEIKKALVE